jgi:hypothetical protein
MINLFATDKISVPGLPKVALDNSVIGIALTLTFTVIGAISVLYIIIGAIRYAMSNGDQKEITQAKNVILYAVIGLVVSLSAVAIVQFVLGEIVG